MRTGRRVAFDIGKARIGVAVSDPHGILATPRDYVERSAELTETVGALAAICSLENCLEIYIGLPNNLKNQATESTEDALLIAEALQGTTDIGVRLIDERFTTKIASAAMSSVGKSTRVQRGSIDSASAAVILESALQHERKSGESPGIKIEEYLSGK